MNSSAIVRKDSIEELCNHRERALSLYALAFSSLIQARDAHRRACIGENHISSFPYEATRYTNGSEDERVGYEKTIRQMVDRDMWRGFIINTPLGSLMDKQERDAFEKSIAKDPPEALAGTVFATMSRLAGEGDLIFRRGLANAFGKLSRDYQSHDGFKLGARIILRGLFTVYRHGDGKVWLSFNHRWEDDIRDVERVFAVLDGKPQPTHMQGICSTMREVRRDYDAPREAESDYFRVRWFLNGNAHLWFKRDDLTQRANKLLAEHYGEALGVGPRRDL